MGRLVHETGFVYRAEAPGRDGFSRFIPEVKEKLSGGGKLQIRKVPETQNLTGLFDLSWTFARQIWTIS